MRYLGNKTKLLGEIDGFMRKCDVRGETFLDVFSGTTSVARHFRRQGWRVHSNDISAASYARQRAYVSLGSEPKLPEGGLERATDLLNHAPQRWGLFSRQFSEGGPAGRLYFSSRNGPRIDGAWVMLVNWFRDGVVDEDGFYVLLCALLEAADRVANISGTYGAFLKKLQTAALKPLEIRAPKDLDWASVAGTAHQRDANELVRELEVDVLYLDPPYNGRQYVKYYHLPEILAELHRQRDLPAYEAGLYGKTGLRGFEDRLSDYCKKRRVKQVFTDLCEHAKARWILVSYSEEGILGYPDIVAALEPRGQVQFKRIQHKRFRSDSEENRKVGSDSVDEWLFCCRVD